MPALRLPGRANYAQHVPLVRVPTGVGPLDDVEYVPAGTGMVLGPYYTNRAWLRQGVRGARVRGDKTRFTTTPLAARKRARRAAGKAAGVSRKANR